MEELLSLAQQLGALGGFAATVAVVINILKTVGWVPDGQAGAWAAGLNLVGLIGLFAAGIFAPEFDFVGLDGHMEMIATILTMVFAYVIEFWVSKGTHEAFSSARLPVIGKSHSIK